MRKPQAEQTIAPAALEGAMRLFWQRGYYDTSIDALIAEAGLNRSMIYRRFKTKRDFFCALLEHYRDTVSAQMTAPLRAPDADLAAVRVFFRRIRVFAESEQSRRGCLMVMTGSEVSSRERSIARIVTGFMDSVRGLFVAALERGRAAGQLPERVEPGHGGRITLTFDDGADRPAHVTALLDLLQKEDIQAILLPGDALASARLHSLRSEGPHRKTPVLVVDVTDPSSVVSLIRAGASDMALVDTDREQLCHQTLRLIRRRR